MATSELPMRGRLPSGYQALQQQSLASCRPTVPSIFMTLCWLALAAKSLGVHICSSSPAARHQVPVLEVRGGFAEDLVHGCLSDTQALSKDPLLLAPWRAFPQVTTTVRPPEANGKSSEDCHVQTDLIDAQTLLEIRWPSLKEALQVQQEALGAHRGDQPDL